jgi:hypothetical protein
MKFTLILVVALATFTSFGQWSTITVNVEPAIYDTSPMKLAITTNLGEDIEFQRIFISDSVRRIVVRAENNNLETEQGIIAFAENIVRFLEPATITDEGVRRSIESYRANKQNIDVMTVIGILPTELQELRFRKLSDLQEAIRSTILGKMLVPHYLKVFCNKGNYDYMYELEPITELQGCVVNISRYSSLKETTYEVASMRAEHEIDNCFETIARGIKKREASGYECMVDSNQTNF